MLSLWTSNPIQIIFSMVCLLVRLLHFGDPERVSAQHGAVLADRPSQAARVS